MGNSEQVDLVYRPNTDHGLTLYRPHTDPRCNFYRPGVGFLPSLWGCCWLQGWAFFPCGDIIGYRDNWGALGDAALWKILKFEPH